MVGKTYANAMRSRKGFSFYLEINLNIPLCQATQVNKEKKYPVLLFWNNSYQRAQDNEKA